MREDSVDSPYQNVDGKTKEETDMTCSQVAASVPDSKEKEIEQKKIDEYSGS
jgi:hypothetical protein